MSTTVKRHGAPVRGSGGLPCAEGLIIGNRSLSAQPPQLQQSRAGRVSALLSISEHKRSLMGPESQSRTRALQNSTSANE